jgi:uncharacterized membrane protein YagU involved in acid resistance
MNISLSREIKYGLISCLIGTVAMDLVLSLEYYISGQPLTTSFMLFGSIIGGGTWEGLILHLLFGSVLGLMFGVLISRFDALRIDSNSKGLKVGVAAGLATIPLGCVPFAIIADVPLTVMLPFVFLPHLVWGLVMGGVVNYLLKTRSN